MGFYGNITNTSNTTFQFDRIYPNRLSMEANANNDGIFIGRYVLVEYDKDAIYPNIYITTKDGETQYFSSPGYEDKTRIQYREGGRPAADTSKDVFYLGEFGQKQEVEKTHFYMCDGYIAVTENNKTINYATFKEVTAVNTQDATPYLINHNIDYDEYKNAKGYDSTVWTKVSEEKDGKLITRYKNIADLNSVVPTFDLETDAPTMTPIVPHFDADSTNVYYKLHTQPQWGLRVAEKSNETNSDSVTTWMNTTYDPITDTTETKIKDDVVAAINYNGPAFEKQIDKNRTSEAGIKKYDNSENYITILPTGESGQKYYTHTNKNGEKIYEKAPDIQEMRISLPAIGNMMSDAWDIIHGPYRNDDMREFDANGKNVSSLKGRLLSIDALDDDTIPVKRDQDGKLVGNKINGGKTTNTDYTGKDDDEWIETLVNGNEEKITIHHTYDLEDKNNYKDIGHSEQINEDNDNENTIDLNNGGKNDFNLNTPIIDSMGHVVGRNTETITLPYGFKYITTNGLAKDNGDDIIYKDLDIPSVEIIEANNTQDTFNINTVNKWLQISVIDSNNTIEFAHEIHPIISTKIIEDTDNLNNKKNNIIQNQINIPDWNFDNAGHITHKSDRIYTLPYGFKAIEVNNSDTVTAVPVNTEDVPTADNTQDILSLSASNNWIKFNTINTDSSNEIQIGHILSPIISGLNGETLNKNEIEYKSSDLDISTFGGDFKILNFKTDNAGHIISVGQDTITLPKGKYEKDTPNTNSNSLLVGMALDGPTGEITTTSATTNTLKLADYSYIGDTNDTQKITSGQTLNNAFGLLEKRINDLEYIEQGSNTQFISKITQSEGIISVERANAGTLTLTGYTQGSETGDINSGDTINSAFAKLQNQITHEENRINTILTGEKDITDTLDTFKELQDYIEQHGTEAANMVEAINTNAKAISDEATLARSEESKLAQAIEAEGLRAAAAEQANTTAIGNEKTRAQDAEAELQGQVDILQTWKETATEDIANLNSVISEMQKTIEDLQKQINELKNPPQEPDDNGETI